MPSRPDVASFVRGLAGMRAGGQCRLVNARTGVPVATAVETALDSSARRRGLLGRSSLPEGHGMVIALCPAIHTCFMQFAIDVIFAARDGRIVALRRHVRPWRAAWAFGAFAAIELPAGTLASGDVTVGDLLRLA